LGVFRNGIFYVDTNANRRLDAADLAVVWNEQQAHPVVGDWDGDGTDELGLYRALKEGDHPDVVATRPEASAK
jgi:hypothetical protein